MSLRLIVGLSHNDVIGCNGALPWRQSADLRRFKQLTDGHVIIMGRKTFESIERPLPNRRPIILTRQRHFEFPVPFTYAHSIEEALERATQIDASPFVIGGGDVFEQALPYVEQIYLTRIEADLAGDTFFPRIATDEWRTVSQATYPPDDKNQFAYTFEEMVRVNQPKPLPQSFPTTC
jgi:dihydrofolate reductase